MKKVVNELFRRRVPFAAWWIGLTAAYCLVFTTVEFIGSPVSGAGGLATLAAQWCVVAFATSGMIGLISVNRYVFAGAFPVLAVLSAVLSYYKLAMGVSFTPMMLELAVVNDLRTWMTVIDWRLVAVACLALCASGAVVWLRWRLVRPLGRDRALDYAALSVAIILVPSVFVGRFRMPVMARMPYSFYDVTRQYLEDRRDVATVRSAFDDVAVKGAEEPPAVVVILGESLRADHLGLNGYRRQTTPLLAGEQNLVSFPNVYSEYTYTHVSVPHIVTRADSVNPDAAYTEPSFITLFNKAGYRTWWISNQDNVGSYAYFIHEADSVVYGNAAKSLYDFSSWYDADLLPHIRRALGRGGEPSLVVAHAIGSHWWYKSHYPDSLAVFRPETDSRILSDLTDEQLVNSYDNTIIATDRFVAEVIGMLRERPALLVYVSDHGESLGEDGNYLHKCDAEELRHPACFVWWSDSYGGLFPEKVAALRGNAARHCRTDVVFHTVIDGAGLETEVLDPAQILFR